MKVQLWADLKDVITLYDDIIVLNDKSPVVQYVYRCLRIVIG